MRRNDRDGPARRKGWTADTGGPGRHRGGLSLVREYRVVSGRAILSVRSDKRDFPPHGLFGGKSGAPSWNIVNPDRNPRVLPVLMTEVAEPAEDDLYQPIMCGGGGFGNPLDRDPELVLVLVRDDKVTPAHARAAYGVVVTGRGRHAALDRQTGRIPGARRTAAAVRTARDGIEIDPALMHRLQAAGA